jgi:transposase
MNDDTTAKILAWMGRRRAKTFAAAADANVAAAVAGDATLDEDAPLVDATITPTTAAAVVLDVDRTGLYTTGIVAEHGPHRIALFFTGRRHAGENLAEVLRRRAENLPPPIQMCDALSRNYPDEFQTIVANCLAHARRKFVEVKDNFLAECEYVLGAIAKVYVADAHAKKKQLTPQERLSHHQQVSAPVMEELQRWLKEQMEQRQVEPNSALGAAIEYLRRHWPKFTLFLRVPGAPLDNNVVERALKKAILHRKNSLFYKTERGAEVGDIHMTLIHTCELCGANPSDYLTQLQRHAAAVAAAPAEWLPWNYRDTLAALTANP